MKNYVLGITGASGAIYGVTLLNYLLGIGHHVYLSLTPEARFIIRGEMDLEWGHNFLETNEILKERYSDTHLTYCDEKEMSSPIASGSLLTEGMVIAPCSMKTLSGIAHGFSSNLIERAADVTLKERRPLILIPRETPLNQIHLRNMLLASEMGATLLPAMPAFYNRPESINDMVRFISGRALDLLSVENRLYTRWAQP
ncbi:MAG: UbiX family flavin prenyltransferase [Nitrospiria bacterium]